MCISIGLNQAVSPCCFESTFFEQRFQDAEIFVIQKPAGKLAWEDNRHRHERGTAVKVDAATRQLEGIIDCLLTHQQKSPRLSPWVQFLGRLRESLCFSEMHEQLNLASLAQP